jgi:hypothetical protein
MRHAQLGTGNSLELTLGLVGWDNVRLVGLERELHGQSRLECLDRQPEIILRGTISRCYRARILVLPSPAAAGEHQLRLMA